jgi:hypothetical protein
VIPVFMLEVTLSIMWVVRVRMAAIIVRGAHTKLSDGRLVFVGRSPTHPGVFIGFRNEEGEDTKLVLSHEAAKALGELLDSPWGDEPFPQGGKTGWRLVRDVAADA